VGEKLAAFHQFRSGHRKEVAHPTLLGSPLDAFGAAEPTQGRPHREYPLSTDATLLLLFALAMPLDCPFGTGYLLKVKPGDET